MRRFHANHNKSGQCSPGFHASRRCTAYILLIWALFISFCVKAVEIRRLSVRDGMQDMVVSAICKDSRGFVWFGTASSIERFDGVHFRHYEFPGTDEKPKWVNVVTEVSPGCVYAGNDMGLWTVTEGKLERVLPKKITKSVRAILHDGHGTVYIGGDAGLYVVRNDKVENILIDSNVLSNSNKIIGMCIQNGRTLWMITEHSLYSMNLSGRKIVAHPNTDMGKKKGPTYKCITSIGNSLYIGTIKSGILRYDARSGTFSNYMKIDGNTVSSISSDGRDVLYVSTDGGGVRFISTRTRNIVKSFVYSADDDNTISSNAVYSLMVDRDGLVWAGTYQLGLNYTLWQGNSFRVYSTPFFNSFDMAMHNIVIDHDVKILGTLNGIFIIDEHKGSVIKFQMPALRSNSITTLCRLNNKVYAGTFGGGMYEIDLGSYRIQTFHPELGSPFTDGDVNCIRADRNGRLWVGTSSGVYRFGNGRLEHHYTIENSPMPGNIVHEMFFDSTGKGWICTNNGMCIYEPSSDRIRTDVFPEGFPNKEKVCMIYEDSRHRLYLMPFKGPAVTTNLSINDFGVFNPGPLLEGKDVRFIIEDKQKQLWIGTDNGLFCYDRKGLLIPYGFADGLPSPVFLSCAPVQDNRGTLWFGNSKGLIQFKPSERKHTPGYDIAITTFSANGVPADDKIEKDDEKSYSISLKSDQRNITIGFSDFRYTDPAYMNFEYKLDGVDEEWRYLNGSSDVNYYNLSPGTYVFRVRHVGIPSSEVVMTVHIASSLTTALMVFSCVAAVCAGLYYYNVKRRKRVKAESADNIADGNDNAGQALEHSEEKYKTGKVSEKECEQLAEKIKQLMLKRKLYTNPELKLSDLAAEAGTTSNALSYMFNQYLRQNYYDFVNTYRIEEFKRIVEAGEHQRFTLNAMMEQCGFSSRTSFFRCFKKQCGLTPTEYIRKQAESSE